MKKIFTFALVMLFAFSMSAQLGTANLTPKQQSDFSMTTYKKESKKVHIDRGVKTEYLNETFETEIPSTWTVVNDGSTGYGWEWDDGTYSSYAYGKGNACANSDNTGGIGTTDLISPAFDCSGAVALYLDYEYQFQKFSTDPDEGTVYVFDGTDWQLVATYNSDILPTSESIDITQYANSALQVKFTYTDGGNYDWMFNVSDVIVYEPEANDMAAISVSPDFVLSGKNVSFDVNVGNAGYNTQNDFTVNLVVNDGSSDVFSTSATVSSANLAIGATMNVTMSDVWAATTAGEYTITATVNLSGDANTANNEISSSFSVVNVSYTTGLIYGYDAYGTYTDSILSIDPSTGVITSLDASTTSAFLIAGDYVEGVILGIAVSTNDVYIVNGDGAQFLVGTISGTGTILGIAYDDVNKILYAIDDSYDLYTIAEDYSATLVGNVGYGCYGIAYIDGALYGVESGNYDLISIDVTTGAGSVVGNTGITLGYAQDIGSDRENNILYGTLYYTEDAGSTYQGGLFTIDVTTGAATLVNSFASEVTMCAVAGEPITKMKELTKNVIIAPNPTSDFIKITAEGHNNINIIDISGKIVLTTEMNNEISIDVSSLKSGIYVIRINNNESYKMIKE